MSSTKKQTPEQQAQEQMLILYSQNLQQQRLIWQLVKKLGGKVEIDQTDVSPLWTLRFRAASDPNAQPAGELVKLLEITSEELPPIKDHHIDDIVDVLRGTSKSIKEAMDVYGFQNYPTHYVQSRMANKIVWIDDKWMSVTAVDPSSN